MDKRYETERKICYLVPADVRYSKPNTNPYGTQYSHWVYINETCIGCGRSYDDGVKMLQNINLPTDTIFLGEVTHGTCNFFPLKKPKTVEERLEAIEKKLGL